jgi:hypothetical protein
MRPTLTLLTLILASLISTVSCDRSGSTESVVKTFTLLPWLETDTGNNTTLSISTPASWVLTEDDKDMVSFRPPDVTANESLGILSVNLFSCPDTESGGNSCIQVWVERHFRGTDPGALQREELGDGRVWVTSSAGKDGKGVSARYYLVDAGKLAVVNFRLGGETSKYLAAFKKAGETLAFTSGK